MGLIGKIRDKAIRHQERHRPLGYQYVFSDSIDFLESSHWDLVARNKTVFLDRAYLQAIEKFPPDKTTQRYAIAYSEGLPVLVMACQLADIDGERLTRVDDSPGRLLARNYKERVLVCGNLVSSGLHGVAFSDQLDEETGWRVVAEVLYKIRRSEKLSGQVDFVIIKDLKGTLIESSKVIERYSYRRIQTDPDMVLDFGKKIENFDAYLDILNSKYRNRARKVIREIDEAGFTCRSVDLDADSDRKLHELYLQVEKKSKTRLATLPQGYFLGLKEKLGDRFSCYGVFREGEMLGFISVVKDREDAIAYYVGLDYRTNDEYPVYFRLLQLVIESAVAMSCRRVLFGRSALEPKANLGAKPVETIVWARHRVPAVNYFVRKLFRNIPFDDAPERGAIKRPG